MIDEFTALDTQKTPIYGTDSELEDHYIPEDLSLNLNLMNIQSASSSFLPECLDNWIIGKGPDGKQCSKCRMSTDILTLVLQNLSSRQEFHFSPPINLRILERKIENLEDYNAILK